MLRDQGRCLRHRLPELLVVAEKDASPAPFQRLQPVAGELTDAIAGLISKYHTETGRPHRLIVAVHPSITEDADPPAEEQQS